MNKQTAFLVTLMTIATIGQAHAFNPGVYYYSNEQTKAERQMVHAKAARSASKRYHKRARQHFNRTTAALNAGVKQHHAYRAYLAAQDEYQESIERFNPYPEYEAVEDRGEVGLRYGTSETGFKRIYNK